jgi:hypothetical protein
MMRTLIALLAAAACSLPAQAQQTDTRQGSEQSQTSRQKTQGVEQDRAGGSGAASRYRDQGGGQMDRAGRAANRDVRRGQRAGRELHGRTGDYESRGRRVYGAYDRGSSYSYAGGRRVYGRTCPHYIYVDGRRVLNERCLGYRTGRRGYFRDYDRGPRYSYSERRNFSIRERGDRRGGVDLGRRTSVRGSDRNRGGERAGIKERRGAAAGQESGQAGAASRGQGSRASRSARNRPGAQTQSEPQPGAR